MNTPQKDPPLLRMIRKKLQVAGHAGLASIAEKSGVPIFTLRKIHYGETSDPGIRNIEKLRLHFRIRLVDPDQKTKEPAA